MPSDVKDVIKNVIKKYSKYETGTQLYDSEDYLWLLSSAEIWGVNAYSTGVEGSQYKYYKNINAIYSYTNVYLKKPSTSGVTTYWWLRSPVYRGNKGFCLSPANSTTYWEEASKYYSVAPGFSI